VTSIALSGNYLAVGTYEGTYVYNVSNIDAPAVIAKWLTGVFQGRVFYDGNRLLVSTFDRYGGDSPVRPYPIIELRIPDVTGVNVNQVDGSAPSSYELSQNYPNPFNPNTTIGFAISKSGFVTLTVYNTLGQEVATVVRGEMAAGCYNASFDASSLSSGMYMYRLNSGDYTSVRKMMLLK
jgi:hypothetical protein